MKICSGSFIEEVFRKNILKLNTTIIWKFEIFNLKEVTLRIKESLKKAEVLNQKTLQNLSELTTSNYEVFEMNFEREIQQKTRSIVHSLLLSFINWLDDIEAIKIDENHHQEIVEKIIHHFWSLVAEIIRHSGHHLTEEKILSSVRLLAMKFDGEESENTITKVKLMSSLKSKAYTSLLCDLRDLKTFKTNLCTELLRYKLLLELRTPHFLRPLEDSLLGRLNSEKEDSDSEEIIKRVFKGIKEALSFSNSSSTLSFISAVRGTSNSILKVLFNINKGLF